MTAVFLYVRWIVFVAVVGLCAPAYASAQSGRCLIEGIVVGRGELSHIQGATVELIGDPADAHARGVRLTASTDGEGRYAIREIPYGPYTLRVSAPGYRTYRIPIYMLSDCKTQLYVRLVPARGSVRR
jgi:hypothetical protein